MHTLQIGGSARQRGQQYGEGLRAAILERDSAWKAHIGRHSPIAPDEFIARHLQSTDYLAAARRWTPDLVEEVEGIAEASGLSFAHVFAAQLMDEEWLFWETLEKPHHCSSLGMAAAGFALAAQNMDLPCWMNGSQTLLHVTDETGLESLVLTAAGMIGLCGMNSAGVGVAVNTLSELPAAKDGLPVAFVSRGLLQRPNLAAARDFLLAVPHAAGQNYVLADRQTVEDYECSAEGKSRFIPRAARGQACWHTNHPLAGGHVVHTQDVEATGGVANSKARMRTLDDRFGAKGGAWSIEAAQAALRSRDDGRYPVSRSFEAHSHQGFTFASVIWELAPQLRAHVAPGPPHEVDYRTIDLGGGQRLAAE